MKAQLDANSDLHLAQAFNACLAMDKVGKGCVTYLDPIDADRSDDPVARITHRQLLRLIFLAAETGARFEREKLAIDPVKWLLTPRALFDGQAAVDACQRQDPFRRGIILHGLSLGLDADPDAIAELLAAGEDEIGFSQAASVAHVFAGTPELSAASQQTEAAPCRTKTHEAA